MTKPIKIWDGTAWQEIVGAPGSNGVGVPSGGTTGQILAKSSDTNYDTEWVGSGGMTLLYSGNLGSVSLSDIPQTYKDLRIVLRNASGTAGFRVNGVTSGYSWYYHTVKTGGGMDPFSGAGSSSITLTTLDASLSTINIFIPDYAYSGSSKNITWSFSNGGSSSSYMAGIGAGTLASSSASPPVTSVQFVGFASGTYELWGVK
jgi:hypothetical protein